MADDAKDGASATESSAGTFTQEDIDKAKAEGEGTGKTAAYRDAQSKADIAIAAAQATSKTVVAQAREVVEKLEVERLSGMTPEERLEAKVDALAATQRAGSDPAPAAGTGNPAPSGGSPSTEEQAQTAMNAALTAKGLDPSKLDMKDLGKFIDGIKEQVTPAEDPEVKAKAEADAAAANLTSNRVDTSGGSAAVTTEFLKKNPVDLLKEGRGGKSPWAQE